MVFSQGKDAMGPTRHHTLLSHHEEGNKGEKPVKIHPIYLILSTKNLQRCSLSFTNHLNHVTIISPFPETAIFDLKGQERTHPLSFASCPEWRRAVFVFYVFFSILCSTYSLLRPTCTLHRSSFVCSTTCTNIYASVLPPLHKRDGAHTQQTDDGWMR